MKITLISFYFMNPGVRCISSYLKERGYDVDLVFLLPDDMYSIEERYSYNVLEDLKKICSDSAIVGLSVLTNDYYRSVHLTQYLKENLKGVIIWGGIHPTIDPESCPQQVDYICVGEGEKGILEIARRLEEGKDISTVENIYYWKDSSLYKNRLRPLMREEELGHFQDFDFDTHYIREKNRIVKVTKEAISENLHYDFENNSPVYLTVFSRGCVHGCTYCCNNKINELYSFERNVYRAKTVDDMIRELKYILNKFPFIKFVYINDDNFLANRIELLREFADRYKKQINIPFKVLGSPRYITEEKIATLHKAGLREVHIGVQSGSERVNKEIYKRIITNESVLKVARLVHKYNLRGRYDFIFDNPYEGIDDQLETARLILKLPKPYIFQPFSLTFFPGTELYKRAKNDGKIFDERMQIYEKVSNEFDVGDVTYLKLVSLLIPRSPNIIGRILISKPLVFLLHRNIFKGIYRRVYLFFYYVKQKLNLGVKSLYR